MIAPAGEHFGGIILCPETHPLARAAAAKAAPDMAAFHAAMGHSPVSHAGRDHAAMGHAGPLADNPAPEPSSTAANLQTCAFAGLALAALLPDRDEVSALLQTSAQGPPVSLAAFILSLPAHLRPPLRGPPVLI